MAAARYTFNWTLPAKYDEGEPNVVVSYLWSPGGRPNRPDRDPAALDPPLVEDVEIRYADWVLKGKLVGMLPEWVEDAAEAACWEDASKRIPQE